MVLKPQTTRGKGGKRKTGHGIIPNILLTNFLKYPRDKLDYINLLKEF